MRFYIPGAMTRTGLTRGKCRRRTPTIRDIFRGVILRSSLASPSLFTSGTDVCILGVLGCSVVKDFSFLPNLIIFFFVTCRRANVDSNGARNGYSKAGLHKRTRGSHGRHQKLFTYPEPLFPCVLKTYRQSAWRPHETQQPLSLSRKKRSPHQSEHSLINQSSSSSSTSIS